MPSSIIPAHEFPLVDPYVKSGVSVLEFGDKRNPSGIYRDWYLSRGASYVSVDINGRHGAHALDVRQPFDLGTFDVVTNFGFSEHVSVQRPYWENAYNALAVGGVFVGTTPQPGHWLMHGWSYWHPMKEFFPAWAQANGMEILSVEDVGPGHPEKRMWGYAIKKIAAVQHSWGFDHLIWRNPNWEIPKDNTVFFGSL